MKFQEGNQDTEGGEEEIVKEDAPAEESAPPQADGDNMSRFDPSDPAQAEAATKIQVNLLKFFICSFV